MIQPCTNAGPAFAAAIGFDNAPEILGATAVILRTQIIVWPVPATILARSANNTAAAAAQ